MGKYSQIIEGKVYAKSLVKFKHSTNKAGESVTPSEPASKIALAFKRNGLLMFKPLRDIKDKAMGNIYYSCLVNKMNCLFILVKTPFYTKIDKNGKPTDKWTRFDIKSYKKAFDLYKKNTPSPSQDDFQVTFSNNVKEEESQEENKEKDSKSHSSSEKKNLAE